MTKTNEETKGIFDTTDVLKRAEVEKVLDDLDSRLRLIDFKRLLTKTDYQIIEAFFEEINQTRKELGVKETL